MVYGLFWWCSPTSLPTLTPPLAGTVRRLLVVRGGAVRGAIYGDLSGAPQRLASKWMGFDFWINFNHPYGDLAGDRSGTLAHQP